MSITYDDLVQKYEGHMYRVKKEEWDEARKTVPDNVSPFKMLTEAVSRFAHKHGICFEGDCDNKNCFCKKDWEKPANHVLQ